MALVVVVIAGGVEAYILYSILIVFLLLSCLEFEFHVMPNIAEDDSFIYTYIYISLNNLVDDVHVYPTYTCQTPGRSIPILFLSGWIVSQHTYLAAA